MDPYLGDAYARGYRNGPPRWVIPLLLVIVALLVAALAVAIVSEGDDDTGVADTSVVVTTTEPSTTASITTVAEPTTTVDPLTTLARYTTLECPLPVDTDDFPLDFCDRGEGVGRLQQALVASGHEITVDYLFGSATREAVIDYQAANGLEADGYVGRRTWESLGLPLPEGAAATSAATTTTTR